MSSEVSKLDTDDEKKHLAHRTWMARALEMSVNQIEDEDVWEVVRPAWRAQSVR